MGVIKSHQENRSHNSNSTVPQHPLSSSVSGKVERERERNNHCIFSPQASLHHAIISH
jgi:hypothetical protein